MSTEAGQQSQPVAMVELRQSGVAVGPRKDKTIFLSDPHDATTLATQEFKDQHEYLGATTLTHERERDAKGLELNLDGTRSSQVSSYGIGNSRITDSGTVSLRGESGQRMGATLGTGTLSTTNITLGLPPMEKFFSNYKHAYNEYVLKAMEEEARLAHSHPSAKGVFDSLLEHEGIIAKLHNHLADLSGRSKVLYPALHAELANVAKDAESPFYTEEEKQKKLEEAQAKRDEEVGTASTMRSTQTVSQGDVSKPTNMPVGTPRLAASVASRSNSSIGTITTENAPRLERGQQR